MPALPADDVLGERAVAGGPVSIVVEPLGELLVGVRGAVLADQVVDRGGSLLAGSAGA